MRTTILGCFLVGTFSIFLSLTPSPAHGSQVVLLAQQATVDSDGDGTPDVVDNAPGAANNQADIDADGIGDVIDPTPNASNPFLGDPGLGLYPTLPILAGASAAIDYATFSTPTPGGWGQILLDFGGDSTFDAIYFGSLTASLDTISIPANLYVSTGWDLNTPGTYAIWTKAIGPGVQTQNVSITSIVVLPVPEPTTMGLLAVAIVAGVSWRHRCRCS